jgi:hypothetical protein
MQPMYYIDLDVHKRKISYCVKDGSGRIHELRSPVDHESWHARQSTHAPILDHCECESFSCRRNE